MSVTGTNVDALQTIICEFKNLSPEITLSFMFNKDGEILASDETAAQVDIKKLISAFNRVAEHATVIGDVETLTIQGSDRQLNILAIHNRYLTMVSSRAADEKTLKSLTHVVVPTIIELIDHSVPEPAAAYLPETTEEEAEPIQETVKPPEEPLVEDSGPEAFETFSSEPSLPEPPVNQFMVEKIGGLLVPSDVVRVDGEVVAKWSDLYGNKEIAEVYIQTLEGKATSCKFRVIKESDSKTRGVIQIPEKILQTLQTSKGKLVVVRPVIT